MSQSQRKIALAVLAVTAAAAGIGIGVWRVRSEALANLPHTADEGLRFMASDRFGKLPPDRQVAYRREVSRQITALPQDQRRALFERFRDNKEIREGLQRAQFNPLRPVMDEYFKKPPQERAALVDKFIDQMEQMRTLGRVFGRGRGAGSAAAPNAAATPNASAMPPQPANVPPRLGAGTPPPEMRNLIRRQIQTHIQEGDPQETAQMMEFMKHVRQRRQERGLPEM